MTFERRLIRSSACICPAVATTGIAVPARCLAPAVTDAPSTPTDVCSTCLGMHIFQGYAHHRHKHGVGIKLHSRGIDAALLWESGIDLGLLWELFDIGTVSVKRSCVGADGPALAGSVSPASEGDVEPDRDDSSSVH